MSLLITLKVIILNWLYFAFSANQVIKRTRLRLVAVDFGLPIAALLLKTVIYKSITSTWNNAVSALITSLTSTIPPTKYLNMIPVSGLEPIWPIALPWTTHQPLKAPLLKFMPSALPVKKDTISVKTSCTVF